MSKLQKVGLRVEVQKPKIKSAEPGQWREDKKVGSAARGYGYKWQKAREQFLLEHPLCVRCKAEGIVRPANVVDHATPHRGDAALFWDRKNWQSLCTNCHNSAKQSEEFAEKFSYR